MRVDRGWGERVRVESKRGEGGVRVGKEWGVRGRNETGEREGGMRVGSESWERE